MAKNYVNNPEFLAAIVAYKKLCVEAEDCGDDNPKYQITSVSVSIRYLIDLHLNPTSRVTHIKTR